MLQIVPESYIDRLLEVCNQNDYPKIEAFVEDVLFEAYSATQILEQLNETVISDFKMSDRKKAIIFDKLSVIYQISLSKF